jgi:hypothetical protein
MKYTDYFLHTKQRPDRRIIEEKWIVETVSNPDFKEVQSDMRLRFWKKIEEAEGKYLRVILLEDQETIHNAFFDRRFKEKK